MRSFLLGAVALAVLPSAAMAQDTSSPYATKFEGFRVEGNVGGDRSQALGRHNDKFGYGGTVGWDGSIGNRIVVGPEASYWNANNGSQVCAGVAEGSACTKSFEEWGAAVRVGYKLTPNVLVFGKGGYVSAEQRKSIDGPTGAELSYDHYHTDGYQVGGGAELSMANRFSGVMQGLYLNAQYVYSNYDDHTSRQRVMAGVGLHFK
jgi:outer membrane immunogenic protein